MLNKEVDTIAYTYPFPAKISVKKQHLYFARAGVLFFMVDIFQNRNYKYSKSKQYHKFFICTHRKRLLPFKARNGGIHTLSAPWLSILYCHGAVIPRFEIGKRSRLKRRRKIALTYPGSDLIWGGSDQNHPSFTEQVSLKFQDAPVTLPVAHIRSKWLLMVILINECINRLIERIGLKIQRY